MGRSWPLDASERRDLLHRVRVFPPEVARWRKTTIENFLAGLSAGRREQVAERLREALDDGLARSRDVLRTLELLQGPSAAEHEAGSDDAGRVLGRLGLFRELEEALGGAGTEAAPRTLAPEGIAPGFRRRLHVLAKDLCHAEQPQCGECDMRNVCRAARSDAVAKARRSAAPTVVDLFAGAGGVSAGFEDAGFRALLALDHNPLALRTYRLNHPAVPDDRVVEADIEKVRPEQLAELIGDVRVDVLIGAPPCQGFSTVGFRSKPGPTGYKVTNDARNYLFEHVVAAAKVLRPRLLLLENVPGMESARRENVSFLELAARMLEEHGFRTAIWRLNAAAFGVPQLRQRCFLVAAAGKMLPTLPPQEYQDRTKATYDLEALPPVTLDEAIFDLPSLEADQGEAISLWRPGGAREDRRGRRYLTRFGLLRPSRILYNHTVRYHNPRDLELYALLKPGEDSVHALEKYGRDDLMRYRSDVFDDKYARLRGDRPCKTIVSHLAKDGNGYIHPTQVRSLSFREAARVQSFHDGYAFCGSPSDQWIQLGNAVPPVLARAIARSFLQTLQRERR